MKQDENVLQKTRHVIERHIELYPKCEPYDIVKLLYQSEFGCEHFVRSKEMAEEYLKREYESCMLTMEAAAAEEHPLTDETSGMFVRVHLEPLALYGISPSRLAELFVRSSEVRTGSTDGMLKKLSLLKEICLHGKTPFDEETLLSFLEKYIEAGCPAIHHSETYRRLYHPAYRVICREFLPELCNCSSGGCLHVQNLNLKSNTQVQNLNEGKV